MQVLRRFKADQSGSTAMLFGLAALPLVGFAGAAMDYSRASSYQSRMQLAVDATALAIVRAPSGMNDRSIQQKGEQYLVNMLRSDPNAVLTSISIKREGKVVKVAAAAAMDTSIMRLLGVNTMPISVESKAVWGADAQKIELALVLDNTGSMNDTIDGRRKIDELISATQTLLKDLRGKAVERGLVKVSLVPFDTEVRLDTATNRYKPWLRWENEARDRPAWTGYVVDRFGSYAATDDAPTSQASAYPALPDSEYRKGSPMGGLSTADLLAMRGLADMSEYAQFSDFDAAIGRMRPRGYTNLTLGVSWGAATLSRSEPFTEGVSAGTPDVKKVMILVTDGKNTARHVDGAIENAEWESSAAKRDEMVRAMNATTLEACTSARKVGVEVFTIRLLEGDADLLRNCASDPSHYKDVQKAGELSASLMAALSGIMGTRLTN